jgi:hypothetical protein
MEGELQAAVKKDVLFIGGSALFSKATFFHLNPT